MSVIFELTRIVQAAAEAESPSAQVTLIVDAIQRAMAVDVCSLYLADQDGAMNLVATRGLDQASVGRVKLPPGKGLVGLVASSRHPVNTEDAANHPAFHAVRETREEQYASFCGVPLVRAGQLLGVLVTQSRQATLLSEEQTAFLVTLATQLAMVLSPDEIRDSLPSRGPRSYSGIKGAPGIGLGRIVLGEEADLYAVQDGSCEDPEAAVAEWHALVAAVSDEVGREQAALGQRLAGEVSGIFGAYQMLLNDTALTGGVEKAIREGRNLPTALKQVVHHYAELFAAMEDPYLRARQEDIHHLGNKLYRSWLGMVPEETTGTIEDPVLLVGRQVSVSDFARFDPEQLAGIACFGGSGMSHAAILANALGIPAVMGLGDVRDLVAGQPAILDGDGAQLILRPSAAISREYRLLADTARRQRQQLDQLREQPAVTRDGCRVELYANGGLLADISPGIAAGAEGLGLYRTEIPFMISETFPSEDEQTRLYSQILEAYGDKPVYMRIMDIGSDKPLPYFPVSEENPALGWRGIRFCLDNSPLLMTQLRAMLRAAAGGANLRLLLPMVSSYGELEAFEDILGDAMAQLAEEGTQVPRPPVGIMVEVPAATSQLSLWRDRLDFISIGSNDLSQYLLAMDRNNPRVARAYDQIHPAVLRELVRIVDSAQDLDLPLSLCGELASDPAAVILLVGMGIRRLSMSAAHLPGVKALILAIDAGEAGELLQEVLAMKDSESIRECLNARLEALGFRRSGHPVTPVSPAPA